MLRLFEIKVDGEKEQSSLKVSGNAMKTHPLRPINLALLPWSISMTILKEADHAKLSKQQIFHSSNVYLTQHRQIENSMDD